MGHTHISARNYRDSPTDWRAFDADDPVSLLALIGCCWPLGDVHRPVHSGCACSQPCHYQRHACFNNTLWLYLARRDALTLARTGSAPSSWAIYRAPGILWRLVGPRAAGCSPGRMRHRRRATGYTGRESWLLLPHSRSRRAEEQKSRSRPAAWFRGPVQRKRYIGSAMLDGCLVARRQLKPMAQPRVSAVVS